MRSCPGRIGCECQGDPRKNHRRTPARRSRLNDGSDQSQKGECYERLTAQIETSGLRRFGLVEKAQGQPDTRHTDRQVDIENRANRRPRSAAHPVSDPPRSQPHPLRSTVRLLAPVVQHQYRKRHSGEPANTAPTEPPPRLAQPRDDQRSHVGSEITCERCRRENPKSGYERSASTPSITQIARGEKQDRERDKIVVAGAKIPHY
jgi:hypothetical protein